MRRRYREFDPTQSVVRSTNQYRSNLSGSFLLCSFGERHRNSIKRVHDPLETARDVERELVTLHFRFPSCSGQNFVPNVDGTFIALGIRCTARTVWAHSTTSQSSFPAISAFALPSMRWQQSSIWLLGIFRSLLIFQTQSDPLSQSAANDSSLSQVHAWVLGSDRHMIDMSLMHLQYLRHTLSQVLSNEQGTHIFLSIAAGDNLCRMIQSLSIKMSRKCPFGVNMTFEVGSQRFPQ